KPVEPTGPELVTPAPGATAFAIDGSDVYWLAPGSGVFDAGVKLADAGSDAHGLASDGGRLYWATANELAVLARGSNTPSVQPIVELRAFAVRRSHVDYVYSESDDRATFAAVGSARVQLDGEDPVIANGIVGTSTALYRGSAATPVDGGVKAIAVDGDDIFFANTALFEKYGNGPINKLGPAGGPVTAMALDADFIYWAIAAGDRDPAIYRARRSKPEMELFTKVGSASQLVTAGEYLYWLDMGDSAIHRIKRQN
ncbi:MAG TPA: hypothetical protein VGG28_19775, partial [Kofleriaceae bacterium]